ncbi:Uncharacterised protein [Burkholderia pseudomallei]|nr:Uncharacterised protein [Burkholderia pseudomallei]CAJ3052173.1 Uncharacterised protein [Burkholderia pseudomallei]CAJ3695382.1 Uncharacterised protein [Burkholderia pseudomallei]CAJ4585193.1 Uncharacterised protein [Burkholderia pseudomallei]CAJ4941504.1 Uncharacterised protein [Burkholderia pseudomallei]
MRGPCGTRRFVRGRQVSNRGLWASRAGRRRMIDIRSRSGRHRADRRRADVHARGGVEQRRATVRPADVARLGNARPGRRADGPPRTRACVCLAGGASRRCAARDTRHATRDTRHATRDTRHATRDTRHAPCAMRHAPCAMRRAPCGVREAACPAPADSMRGDAGRRREGDALAACVEPRAAALADSIEPMTTPRRLSASLIRRIDGQCRFIKNKIE